MGERRIQALRGLIRGEQGVCRSSSLTILISLVACLVCSSFLPSPRTRVVGSLDQGLVVLCLESGHSVEVGVCVVWTLYRSRDMKANRMAATPQVEATEPTSQGKNVFQMSALGCLHTIAYCKKIQYGN